MVEYAVLASGSRGNSTYLSIGGLKLLIDCGLSCKGVEQRLAGIGVNPDEIDAVLLSHEHHDHVRSIHTFCRRHETPLISTEKTFRAARLEEKKLDCFMPIQVGRVCTELNGVEIFPCPLPHDAVEPVGFILAADGLRISVITDLGYPTDLVAHEIRGSDVLIMESNHDPHMLKMSGYPWELKQRIMSRRGHLSNGDAADLIARSVGDNTRKVILAHLSEENNHPDIAVMTTMQKLNGRTIELEVALQNRSTALFRLE